MPRFISSATSLVRLLGQHGRRLAQHFRGWWPVWMQQLLAADARLAHVQPVKSTLVVRPAERVEVPIRMVNLGDAVWSSRGRYPVVLHGAWLSQSGDPLPVAPLRIRLPAVLRPGESLTLPVRFQAPKSLGDFTMRWQLLQEPDAAFTIPQSELAELVCHVEASPHTAIDYDQFYAASNLARDYWTVVGPRSRAEYDRLAQVKLGHLIDLGLTPNARLLDVGCGTGLLTQAVEAYLSDQGFYLGTDIAAEAIDFCRARFGRPNFRFVRNAMTQLPQTDQRFDIIVCYSVLTHVYPDEAVLLLAEAKRLLAPGGVIFADLFVSPLVERSAGNRGAVEMNRAHFERLVGLIPLQIEEVMASRWGEHGQRLFLAFRLP